MKLTPEQEDYFREKASEYIKENDAYFESDGINIHEVFDEVVLIAQTPKALILNPLVAGLVFRLNQATDYFRERDWPGVTEHYEESLKPFEKYLKGDE